MGNFVAVLIADADVVKACTSAVVQFISFGCEHIAGVYRLYKVYGCIKRHAEVVPVVAGKCESAVCQAECDAAVHNAKAVEHFFPHRHLYFAVAFFYFNDADAEPPAEPVVLHHMIHYFRRRSCF